MSSWMVNRISPEFSHLVVNMDPLSELPIELLLKHIIPNLDLPDICRLKQVSTTWRDLIRNYLSRLKQLDLTEFKHILNESGFASIIPELSRLQDICLDWCWMVASKINLLELFCNCQEIRSFSAKHCKYVDDEVLEELAVKCTLLESIDISSCFQITNTGIKALFKGCSNLQVFSASKNYGFTDDAVKFIGEHCSSLVELDIGSCFYVTDVGLQTLLDGKCKKMSYLRIKGCNRVSDQMVQKFVERGIIVNNCY